MRWVELRYPVSYDEISRTFTDADKESWWADFEMAFGSLMEVDCQIDIAQDLGYVSLDEHEEVTVQISKVAALLSGMRRKILGENSLIH